MSSKPNVLVLSGFLGSGKTTLLVRVIEHLRAKHGEDYRIAIVENEIGSTSVDSDVIAEAGYTVTELLSGCVCCTLIGQLVPALDKLAVEVDPQLIIIEATGMALPGSMRDNIVKYGGYPVRVAVLVDASRWQRIVLALSILLEGQLECADVVCVNKVDLVEQAELDEVVRAVGERKPDAPIVCTSADSPIPADDIDLIAGV